jgi:hypothetical protein
LAVAEELVVGVVTAMAAGDFGEVGDEVDAGEPLDLLEAELDLVAEPSRCTVPVGERLAGSASDVGLRNAGYFPFQTNVLNSQRWPKVMSLRSSGFRLFPPASSPCALAGGTPHD